MRVLLTEEEKLRRRREYDRRRSRTPERKERARTYRRVWVQRPEVKARIAERAKDPRRKEQISRYQSEYYKRPEIVEYRRQYLANKYAALTPEQKAEKIRVQGKLNRDRYRAYNKEYQKNYQQNRYKCDPVFRAKQLACKRERYYVDKILARLEESVCPCT